MKLRYLGPSGRTAAMRASVFEVTCECGKKIPIEIGIHNVSFGLNIVKENQPVISPPLEQSMFNARRVA